MAPSTLVGTLRIHYSEFSTTINAVNENEFAPAKSNLNYRFILNVLKQNEDNLKEKFSNIDNDKIISRLHENEENQYQAKLFNIFSPLSLQLSLTSASLHQI